MMITHAQGNSTCNAWYAMGGGPIGKFRIVHEYVWGIVILTNANQDAQSAKFESGVTLPTSLLLVVIPKAQSRTLQWRCLYPLLYGKLGFSNAITQWLLQHCLNICYTVFTSSTTASSRDFETHRFILTTGIETPCVFIFTSSRLSHNLGKGITAQYCIKSLTKQIKNTHS